jgi:hypothetical protein
MARWKTSSKRINDLKGLMYSFKDVKLEGTSRYIVELIG